MLLHRENAVVYDKLLAVGMWLLDLCKKVIKALLPFNSRISFPFHEFKMLSFKISAVLLMLHYRVV